MGGKFRLGNEMAGKEIGILEEEEEEIGDRPGTYPIRSGGEEGIVKTDILGGSLQSIQTVGSLATSLPRSESLLPHINLHLKVYATARSAYWPRDLHSVYTT